MNKQLLGITIAFLLSALIGALLGYFIINNTPLLASQKQAQFQKGYTLGFENGRQELIKTLDDTLVSILEKFPESILSTYQNSEGDFEARGIIRQIEGNKLTIFINKERTGQIPTVDEKFIEATVDNTTQVLEKQSLRGHIHDYTPGNIGNAKAGQFVIVVLNQPKVSGELTIKKLLLWPKIYLETFN